MSIFKTGELMGESALTPEFRVSFPYVFTGQPKDKKKDGATVTVMKYSVMMLFPKDADLTVLATLVNNVMAKKFGEDKTKWPKIRKPFRDQAEKVEKYKGYEAGAVFAAATTETKPGVLDVTGKRIVEPSEFYAGCYAMATIRAFYYKNTGNEGIAFGLSNIMKTRDGENISGRASAEEEFKAVVGQGATPSPAALKDLFD